MKETENMDVAPKSESDFGKVVMFGTVPGIMLGAVGISTAAAAVSDDFDDVVDDFKSAASDLFGGSAPVAEPVVEPVAESVEVNSIELNSIEVNYVEVNVHVHADPAPVAEPEVETVSAGLPVAVVSDEMSFGKAFASARSQVGADGVFAWRGNNYSTFYKEEWDAMSPQDKEAYMHKYYETDVNEVEKIVEEPVVEDVVVTETVTVTETVVTETVTEVEFIVEQPEASDEVWTSLEGNDALYVDLDSDGFADYVACDMNENGDLDYDEIVDIKADGISMSDIDPMEV